MPIDIGECRFDSVRREVRRGSERVHLSPKAFELLGILLERRPRAVSKDELMLLLWPKTFVTEASLAVLVGEIRRELKDDAREPRYLRTIHGFGYAISDGRDREGGGRRLRLPADLGRRARSRSRPARTSWAASPRPRSSSTTRPSPGITPASWSNPAGRSSRISAARTERGSAGIASPGRAFSRTETSFASGPSP